MSLVVQIAFGPIMQCLTSISGSLDIARRVNSKMAGDMNLGKLQIAMRENGCLGDMLGQDH